MKKKILENCLRFGLMIILMLNFIDSILISFTNPEAYFFGEKLGGFIAIIYILTGGVAGVVIVYFLFKKKSKGEILSLFYFGYFIVEGLITNLSHGFGFVVSPIAQVGLGISMVLIVIRKMVYR